MVCYPPDQNAGCDDALNLVQSLAVFAKTLPKGFVNEDQCGGLTVVPHLSEEQIRDQQWADPCLKEVIAQLKTGEKPSPIVQQELPNILLLQRELSHLELHNQILYWTRQGGSHIT